jgi:hypothetical protein
MKANFLNFLLWMEGNPTNEENIYHQQTQHNTRHQNIY